MQTLNNVDDLPFAEFKDCVGKLYLDLPPNPIGDRFELSTILNCLILHPNLRQALVSHHQSCIDLHLILCADWLAARADADNVFIDRCTAVEQDKLLATLDKRKDSK